jgi:hypothetical protein
MDGLAAPFSDLPAEVNPAAWLRRWQRDNRFTDSAAADELGLSLSAFRRQKTGRARVSRQTYLLALYTSVHRRDWLDIAEICYRLARRGRPPARPDLMTQMPGAARNSMRTSTSSKPQDFQYAEIRRPSASAPAFSK